MPAAKYDYPIEKTCPVCRSTWEATTAKEVDEKQACSPDCSTALRAWSQRGTSKEKPSKSPEKRDGVEKIVCEKCGDEKWYRKDRVDENNFCSRECYQEWRKQDVDMSDHLREIAPKGEMSEEERKKLSERMSGDSNPAWKGGITYKNGRGNVKREILVRCPDEFLEMARANGYVPEHRLKVAKKIGRPLTSEEVVHHVDHDRHNNEIENLELYPNNRIHKLMEGNREEYLSERLWPEPPE